MRIMQKCMLNNIVLCKNATPLLSYGIRRICVNSLTVHYSTSLMKNIKKKPKIQKGDNLYHVKIAFA